MVTPLPHAGADSSLMERLVSPPTIVTTPGGMSLNLSPRYPPSQASRWDFNFQLLLQFKQREGHLRVPKRHLEDGHRLGCWITNHRYKQIAGSICPERLRRLNEIGFTWKAHEGKWDVMLRTLLKFQQREGHLRVPQPHIEDGKRLGAWVCKQRFQRNAGTLVSEKEVRLNDIGLFPRKKGHNDERTKNETNETMFRALTQFKQREGHLRVPSRHVEDFETLGAWTGKQRKQKRVGTLCPEDERRLNEIGFIWNDHEETWETMIRALTQFKEREGQCNVIPEKNIVHIDGGNKVKLGAWLSQQRYRQRTKLLDAQKQKRLESLGVRWNNHKQEFDQELFDRNFDLLLVFNEREGHVRVPFKHQESAADNLGTWLTKQRYRHRHGLLELDRQKWLEVAGVTWESRIGA
jgi:hypothetical protein